MRDRLIALADERLRLLIQRARVETVRAAAAPEAKSNYDRILAQIEQDLAVVEARLELIVNAKDPE